eukprot:11158403-Lingulodinium_polyedra.AAC.1
MRTNRIRRLAARRRLHITGSIVDIAELGGACLVRLVLGNGFAAAAPTAAGAPAPVGLLRVPGVAAPVAAR